MAKLRHPENGCPWDMKQTLETVSPYAIEEAYEVDEAIRNQDMPSLKAELGDLLFQTIFQARIAEESNLFDFQDVVHGICEKMVRRHPHVFGDSRIENAAAQTIAWESQKANEREIQTKETGSIISALDGVAKGLPALLRAVKLQNRAARVGFDWPETIQVIEKIEEECAELLHEVNSGKSADKIKEEFGDLLFVMSNLARHLKLEPEQCLREANVKFERRFQAVELKLRALGKTPAQSNLEEMDALWDQVKAEE